MPVRYREQIMERSGGKLVFTLGSPYPCLAVYAKCDWDAKAAEVGALDNSIDENWTEQHQLIGSARDTELDSNGRVVIPAELRGFVELDKRAVIVGQPGRLELWNHEGWEKMAAHWKAQAEKRLAKLLGEAPSAPEESEPEEPTQA